MSVHDGPPIQGASTGATPGYSLVVSPNPSNIRWVNLTIDPAVLPGAPTCLMLFDANTPPVNGATPTWRWHIPNAGGTYEYELPHYASMPLGCTFVLSTTFTTLTAAVGAAVHIHALYQEDFF